MKKRLRSSEWDIQLYSRDGVLRLEADAVGEVPTTEAWFELLDILAKWSEKHNELPLRIFKIPSILEP